MYLLNLLANKTSRVKMLTGVNHNMIVLAREARGLTQQDLADRLNLHRANVSRLEKGSTSSFFPAEALALELELLAA